MRRIVHYFTLAAIVGALAPTPSAQAAPNVPLCFAIANNYNNCMRQFQRGGGRHGWNNAGPGSYGGYGGGGWNGGDYDDDYQYRVYRQQRRAARAQANCAIWLAQMQASGCTQ